MKETSAKAMVGTSHVLQMRCSEGNSVNHQGEGVIEVVMMKFAVV